MRVVKKNVYYCEYCGKHSLSPSLKIHEQHCTANPNRSCRLCERESIKEIIDKYRKYFYLRQIPTPHEFLDAKTQVVYLKKFTLEDLEGELDYECPNCLLAIIRCLGLNRYYFKDKFKIDYKEMLGYWWEMTNERAREEDTWQTTYY